MRIPLPTGQHVAVHVHVVKADVPLLIGMDVLCAERLILDFGAGTILQRGQGWSLPMKRKNGHVFIEWSRNRICYTHGELRRLHLHFFHPSAERLFSLIRKVSPHESGGELNKTIDQLTEACEPCRKFAKRPFRFRAALPPDRIIFNHEISVDLLWLDGKPVLHIVDTHTHFQNAVPIRTKRAEDVWYAFVEGCASIYVGYPNIIRLDRESTFRSEYIREITDAMGIELQFSGVESHNSIGAGERYHAPLRRIFRLIRMRYLSLEA